MNKQDLIDAIARQTSLPKRAVDDVLHQLGEEVRAALCRGEEVAIPGVCRIGVKQRQARTGRNPNSGEPLAIPAKKAAHFSAVKVLKDVVNA